MSLINCRHCAVTASRSTILTAPRRVADIISFLADIMSPTSFPDILLRDYNHQTWRIMSGLGLIAQTVSKAKNETLDISTQLRHNPLIGVIARQTEQAANTNKLQ